MKINEDSLTSVSRAYDVLPEKTNFFSINGSYAKHLF